MSLIQQHTNTIAQLAAELKSNLQAGLSGIEAQDRLAASGPNLISVECRRKPIAIFLAQFANPMVYLLGFAALMSLWFEEYLDAAAIFLVILINVFIGLWMELQAEQSMNALRKLSTVSAKVIRDGSLLEIPSEEVVPGDVMFFEAGDMVTADARLLDATMLTANESSLTGESMPVEKKVCNLPVDTPLADRTNMLFKGTFISNGNGKALALATGMQTELGKIAHLVTAAQKTAVPLEKKMQAFSQRFIYISLVLVVLIFAVGLLTHSDSIELFKTAIALAVAAIPEGMPVVATLALAQGMLKMAKHKVIVKKLAAVETLGGTTVICTDKTGTLTENKIELAKVLPVEENSQKNSELLMHIAVLCNNASVEARNDSWHEVGDPLETGLLKYALKHECCKQKLEQNFARIHEVPFTSETKVMATLHETGDGLIVLAKGAAEQILDLSSYIQQDGRLIPVTKEMVLHWKDKAAELSSSGMKVLAGAWKNAGSKEDNLLEELVFAGLFCFVDPIAAGIPEAVKSAREAGIKVIMITGDHPATAQNIAAQLQISSHNDKPLTGSEMMEFSKLTENEKKKWINTTVFARVTPAQKLDLVTVLQEHGHIVGMTGDGVNDAPALKKADIGIAMGRRGTQVAQEAADMILTDDDFSSIVYAIRQGRTIFNNIRKFVVYLLSCNMSELFVIAVVALAGFNFQLVPIQILFINLVTDVLPALALGVGKGHAGMMKQEPAAPDAPLLNTGQWRSVWIYSAVISVCTLAPVLISYFTLSPEKQLSPELYNNLLFFTIILSQLLHVFNMGSAKMPFFGSEIFRNKYVWYALFASVALIALLFLIPPARQVLRFSQLSFAEWGMILSAALSSVIIIRLLKRSGLVRDDL